VEQQADGKRYILERIDRRTERLTSYRPQSAHTANENTLYANELAMTVLMNMQMILSMNT